MNPSPRRTLAPPAPLRGLPAVQPPSAEGAAFCPTCGNAMDALDRLLADRDRLAAALDVAQAELARLRQGRADPPAPQAAWPPRSDPYASVGAASGGGAMFAAPAAPFVAVTTALPGGAVAAPGQGIDFGAVARLSPDELDKLPYGLITVDAQGRVIHYNDTESRLVGLPKERVVGRNFFGEVAPCTRVREFEGRFVELARDPSRVRVQSFDFVFRFARGEQHVSIVITPARLRGQFHMALIRRAILP